MTVTTVAINCDVSLADDSEFSASQIDFTLSGPDYDTVSNDAIPAATISVALDADGLGTANIWPVDRGTRNTYYTVTVTGARTIGGKVVAQTLDLGRIAPPEDGAPHDLADLLAQSSGSIAVGSTIYATLADAVAAALAAQVLAEASAQSAGTAAIAAGAAIYPTTAAGIAAVADGGLFYVPASGGGLTIYERDGASAVQVGTVALPDVPTLRDFGVADDTAAIQAALDYLKASGGVVRVPAGTYRLTGTLLINTTTKPWALLCDPGAKFVRAAAYGSVISIHTSNDWTIDGLEIDAGFAEYPTNANHGIVWYNCSRVRVRNCKVSNYKNTGIIGYTFPASLDYDDNIVDQCITDGLDAANNGMLLASLYRSGLINCQALNVGKSGSPCYGLQMKNGCQESFIRGGRATGASIGIATGNYDTEGTHLRNMISGVHVFNCDTGFALGNARATLFSDLVIDMNNQGQSAVDFNLNSIGCTGRNIAVHNLAAAKIAVNCRSGDTDNTVHLSSITNDSGLVRPIAQFLSGAERNTVTLDRYVNPTTVTSTTTGLFVDTSGVSTNQVRLNSFPLRYSYTIASGAITLNGPGVSVVRVDTEGAAATDDLVTINGGIDGQIITLNTLANARDVVVKHSASGAGTIRLNGAADFTLDVVADRIALQYDGVLTQWCEIGRGNN